MVQWHDKVLRPPHRRRLHRFIDGYYADTNSLCQGVRRIRRMQILVLCVVIVLVLVFFLFVGTMKPETSLSA